ncbi:hypothetical protein QR685DRAFT_527194 [Neurospora intermedia]|uniref:Secreted protein n=1 Tax=Neurospora intermedia TaxID=5142 RepID=A0ABR3DAJ1_NEUIN
MHRGQRPSLLLPWLLLPPKPIATSLPSAILFAVQAASPDQYLNFAANEKRYACLLRQRSPVKFDPSAQKLMKYSSGVSLFRPSTSSSIHLIGAIGAAVKTVQ